MFETFYPEITALASDRGEEEMLAIIRGDKLIPLTNAAPDPVMTFVMSTADTHAYMLDGKTQAIVHSHPPATLENGTKVSRLSPSKIDMQQQVAGKIPWVITAMNVSSGAWETFEIGDHILDLPILERPFRHGVEDCYELIRKSWWQKFGVKLPQFPRGEGWWGNAIAGLDPLENMYLDGFAAAGFERFFPTNPRELMIGDVWLWKLGATVYNHAGIIGENDLTWHHAPGRLSQQDPIGPWFRRLDYWIRRPI